MPFLKLNLPTNDCLLIYGASAYNVGYTLISVPRVPLMDTRGTWGALLKSQSHTSSFHLCEVSLVSIIPTRTGPSSYKWAPLLGFCWEFDLKVRSHWFVWLSSLCGHVRACEIARQLSCSPGQQGENWRNSDDRLCQAEWPWKYFEH